jgi:hypothetical protein
MKLYVHGFGFSTFNVAPKKISAENSETFMYETWKEISHTVPYCTYIFDPALLDLEVAIAKNVVYFHRNE